MDFIMYCLEAPQGNFLKEVITTGSGQRLIFTDRWDDDPMTFGVYENAEIFKKSFGLDWLIVTEHGIYIDG